MRKIWILGIAAVSLFALYGGVLAQQQFGQGPAQGQGPGGGMRKPPALSFDEMDTNHDGHVTVDEFIEAHRALLTKRFELMDTNGDKMITKDEVEAGAREHSMHHTGFGPLQDQDHPPFDLGNPPEEQPDAQQ